MLEKKYVLTDEIKVIKGVANLRRIQAVRDFGNVKKGDFGGFIEKEENLSHEGLCWVYDDAQVYNDARIEDNASVHDTSRVFGNAKIYGDASIHNRSCIYDDAKIYNGASTFGDARVYGAARVHGECTMIFNAKIYDDAVVRNGASIYDNCEIYNNAIIDNSMVGEFAKVFGYASLVDRCTATGHAQVSEYARLCGRKCIVSGNSIISGHAVILGQCGGRSSVSGNVIVGPSGAVSAGDFSGYIYVSGFMSGVLVDMMPMPET